eukprot:m.73261 g.73261  ORF g.73261 m.73261 type:complete len:297 (+) comp14320_c0_seq2:177-1067(+)
MADNHGPVKPPPGIIYTDSELDQPEVRPVELAIQRIGIYGWRKYCLYCSTLLLFCLALVNFGLMLWVIDVMELKASRAGPMHIRESSVSIRGDVEFTKGIVCNNFSGFDQEDLTLESNQDVRLRAVEPDQQGGSAVTLTSGQVEVITPSFQASFNNSVYFNATPQRLELSANQVLVTSASGLVVNGEVQANRLANNFVLNQGLTIESVGQALTLQAAEEMSLVSQTGDVTLSAFGDVALNAGGILRLNGGDYVLDSLPTLTTDVGATAFQLCVCASGRLYRVAAGAVCTSGIALCA